jgi:hypothetical protein
MFIFGIEDTGGFGGMLESFPIVARKMTGPQKSRAGIIQQ